MHPEGAAKTHETPEEMFNSCCEVLKDVLSKLLQNGGVSALRSFTKWCRQPKEPRPMISFSHRCTELTFSKPSETVKKAPSKGVPMDVPMSINFKSAQADVD